MMTRTNKAGWREIGDKRCYFKSAWEANYARYLQWLKENGRIIDWEYEPQDFWFKEIKRGVRSYKPDFKVSHETYHYWVEVKGYYDSKSLTKIKRFRKYYPKEILTVIDKEWFAQYGKIYSFIPGWETQGIRLCKSRLLVTR